MPELPASHILAIGLACIVALAAPFMIYAIHVGVNPLRCVVKDPACSLTVSTYLLCALTATVFIATFRGAQGAWEAVYNDRRVIVVVDPIDQILPGTPLVQFVLDRLEDGFAQKGPISVEKPHYDKLSFACLNAGRSPFVHGVLDVMASEDYTLPLRLGSIKAGEWIYLEIWIRSELPEQFSWALTAHSSTGDEIECYAEVSAWHRVRTFKKNQFAPTPQNDSDA